jgi:hypothetical protein
LTPALLFWEASVRRLIYPAKNYFSCYALSARLGYAYIDNANGRPGIRDTDVWVVRHTRDPQRKGPGIWVGSSSSGRYYVVELEEGALLPGERKEGL